MPHNKKLTILLLSTALLIACLPASLESESESFLEETPSFEDETTPVDEPRP